MSNRPPDLTSVAGFLAGGLTGILIALFMAPRLEDVAAHRRKRRLFDATASPHGAAGRVVQEPAFTT